MTIQTNNNRANAVSSTDHQPLTDNMTALGIATFNITSDLVITKMNGLAEALFQHCRLLAEEQHMLKCTNPLDQQSFVQALHATKEQRGAVAMAMKHHEGDELTLIVQPTNRRANDVSPSGASTYCVLVRPSPTCLLRLSRQKLNQQFGITTAEVEVLSMILRGVGAHEIATRRATSSETIRSQIKALCAKTGSRGQLGLVAFASANLSSTELTTTRH